MTFWLITPRKVMDMAEDAWFMIEIYLGRVDYVAMQRETELWREESLKKR